MAVLVCAVFVGVLFLNSDPAQNRRLQLADGSTLEIRQVTFSNGFQYRHEVAPRWLRVLRPITPEILRKRFLRNTGSLGFGGDGSTNLYVITVNSSTMPNWWSGLQRLVVFDETGNTYDACWGASTLGMPGEVVHGWNIHSLPRRTRWLGLRFLSKKTPNASKPADGSWDIAAECKIRNPAYSKATHWTAEPWPITKSDGDLAVTLEKLQSGAPYLFRETSPEDPQAPRQTRANFGIRQNGTIATNRTVQKIIISDATGNRWSPFLGFGLGRVTNGVVEFAGALWPGEAAWKLDLEFVRTNGFAAEELWESPLLTIPVAGVDTNLHAEFARDHVRVRLVGLAAPQADQPEPFKWTAKYWGEEDKDKIMSLSTRITPGLEKRRLTLVGITDEKGKPAELVEHRNQDGDEQAVLFKPAEDAHRLKFTFALQRSRFVQFLARPDFKGR